MFIASSAHALTWFNISGVWRDGEGDNLTIIQNDNKIKIIANADSEIARLEFDGRITQKPLKSFRVSANLFEVIEAGKVQCTVSGRIEFSGEKVDGGLAVGSCYRDVVVRCSGSPPVRDESHSCSGFWRRQ